MFPSVFDTVPTEIILLVAENLDPEGLLSLLYCLRWVPKLLTRQHITNRDKDGNTILHVLAKNGEADLIKSLLSKYDINPDPRNGHGETPLSSAAMNGHKEIVELLLLNDSVYPDSVDHSGLTPLWWTAEAKSQEIMEILLTQGNADSK
jgi:ankyrin repeat protein